jgi:prepilin-type N-terminal cleavage/methylation domain-containing protein
MIDRTQSASDGFSLIELMVTVAIVSVLAIGATLALPRSSASERASAELVALTREVRLKAMLSGEVHRITPDGAALSIATSGETVRVNGLRVEGDALILTPDGWVEGGPLRLEGGAVCAVDNTGRVSCRNG